VRSDGVRQVHLVAMVQAPTSQYAEGWRHPASRTDWLDVGYYTDLARTLERGCFDMVFLPDSLAVPEDHAGDVGTTLRTGGKGAVVLDPLVVLSAMAAVTTHLGLGATVSTTFTPPYAIARSMLSLDHLSGGRAAWNVVTSTTDEQARNFGLDAIPAKADRYDSADRVVQTVLDLWDSWSPGALVLDAEGRRFADPALVHRTPDRGGPVRSRGPLSLPRSPQGRPVLMQAGASARGRRFAGRWAEVVFSIAGSAEAMRQERAALRRAAVEADRDPDDVLFLPAVQPVVGATHEDAAATLAELESHVDEQDALAKLGRLLHAPAEELDPAASGAELVQRHRGSTGSDGFEEHLVAVCRAGGMTVRDLALRQVIDQLKPRPLGDPEQVADELCELVDSAAADGFVVTFPVVPSSVDDFVDGVVPALQRRGRLRRDYSGRHLRSHLAG